MTESEILSAVREAAAIPDAPPDAMTVRQLQEALGLTRQGVNRALAKLREQGRLQVYRARREDATGRTMIVAAYTILPAKKGKR